MEWHTLRGELVYCEKGDLHFYRRNAGIISVSFFDPDFLQFHCRFEKDDCQEHIGHKTFDSLRSAKDYIEAGAIFFGWTETSKDARNN